MSLLLNHSIVDRAGELESKDLGSSSNFSTDKMEIRIFARLPHRQKRKSDEIMQYRPVLLKLHRAYEASGGLV